MKDLKKYIAESKKTYNWKIGVAGDLPEGFEDILKTSLEKFQVNNFKKTKTTPIQESPLEFPNISNSKVTYFEVELSYPTTDFVLKEYLGTVCRVPASHIVVRNPNSPLELDTKENESTEYESLLTKEDMGGESAQQSVGNNRVMDLLKELETAKKERAGNDGFKVEAAKTEPNNNKSTIGS